MNQNDIEKIKRTLRKRTDYVRNRVEKAIWFLQNEPEEKISIAFYLKLSSDVECNLRNIYDAIAEMPNHRVAREQFGELLAEALVARGEYKDEISLHEKTKDIGRREADRGKEYKRNTSHFYRVRTLKSEFGSSISSNGRTYKYIKFEMIPDHCINRSSLNREIRQLLLQKREVSKATGKQQKTLAKYDCFLNEMERRITDCRHVLMITEQTDKDEKRMREAFALLYEALDFRKQLIAASAEYRTTCKEMAA